MKIACQSCGAKYSIADDKVQGKKVFKIKCKKCGADIIVRGDQAAPGDQPSADVSAGLAAVGADQFPEDEATRVVGGGDNDPIWHAAIDDNNTGPFSINQLKQYVASGQVNGETSVWKDGFADWKPLKDVPELAVQLLSGVPAATPAPTAAAAGDALFGGGGAASGGLFAAESKPAAKAAARTASKAASGNDLFGGGSSSMFGDESVETSAAASSASTSSAAAASTSSAASPKLDAAAMTGQRNENSVLFSLATLQQVAGSAPAKTESKKDADSSGLIDIKSMGSSMGPGGLGNKSAVDEILSVGAGGGLASPLAAPVLAPVPAPAVPAAAEAKPKGSNTTVIASVLGASIILVGGGLGAVYLLKSGQPTTQVGAEGSGPNTANTNTAGAANNAGANNAAGTAAGAAGAAGVGAQGAQGAPAGSNPTPPAGNGAAATGPSNNAGQNEPSSSGRGERTTRPSRPSNTANSTSSPSNAQPASNPPANNNSASTSSNAAATTGNNCAQRCRGDIACLLQCGTARPSSGSSPSGPAAPAANTGAGPEAPSRNDVMTAMRGVQPAVRACAEGQTGLATVTITFASTGRVTTANVAPPFAGTPAGSCIARAVRAATVPPFTRPTFQVNYPFAL
jgi:predicted Zn finger-like uncharacterized protein